MVTEHVNQGEPMKLSTTSILKCAPVVEARTSKYNAFMKLLLTSAGLSNLSILKALEDLLEKPAKGAKLCNRLM